MWKFLFVLCGAVFFYGLMQWSMCGSILWDILKLNRETEDENGEEETSDEEETGASKKGPYRFGRSTSYNSPEQLKAKKLRDMEKKSDHLLWSSFRVLGGLAVFVWFFIAVILIAEMLGWKGADTHASYFWSGTSSTSQMESKSAVQRKGMIRSIGSALNR